MKPKLLDKWDAAIETANTLVKLRPAEAGSWVALAHATRQKSDDGISRAKAILEEVAHRFPKEGDIPYKLACYCTQLGQLKEAAKWLRTACEVGDAQTYMTMVLSDPDLAPLRKGIAP